MGGQRSAHIKKNPFNDSKIVLRDCVSKAKLQKLFCLAIPVDRNMLVSISISPLSQRYSFLQRKAHP